MFVKSYMLLNEKKIHCKKKVVNLKMSFPIRCSFFWGLLLDVANQNIIPFTGILGGVYFVYSLRPFLSHSFISLSQAFHFLFLSCSFSHHSGVVYAESHHFFSPVSARECVASTQLSTIGQHVVAAIFKHSQYLPRAGLAEDILHALPVTGCTMSSSSTTLSFFLGFMTVKLEMHAAIVLFSLAVLHTKSYLWPLDS